MEYVEQFLRWLWYAIKSIIKLPYSAFRWYIRLYKSKPWYVKLVVPIITFICCVFFYFFAVFVNFLWLFGETPSANEIMQAETPEASLIYYCDSTSMGKYFRENRQYVDFKSVNPMFFKTLIDTEDERFYEHKGIDFLGIGSAIKDIFSGSPRGASTITQQLAKNLFNVRNKYSSGLLGSIPGVKLLIQKTKEMIVATELEMLFSKEQILEMYANTVDFGSNAKGIYSASQTFFGKHPKHLTTDESAVLVGLLKATATYNPHYNYDKSIERRNVVINNLYTHNDISKSERDQLCAKPIDMSNYKVEQTIQSSASPYVYQEVAKYLKKRFKELGKDYDIYEDGLRIYTTIDPTMQKYAEEAVKEKMSRQQKGYGSTEKYVMSAVRKLPRYRELAKLNDSVALKEYVEVELKKPHEMEIRNPYTGVRKVTMSSLDSIREMLPYLQAGFVAIEPSTHYIKAWVGNVDWKTWNNDNAREGHQVGSTFKGIVYTTAMERGWNPKDVCKGTWTRLKGSGGAMTLIDGIRKSMNGIAVNTCNFLTPDSVAHMARKLGVVSTDFEPFLPVPEGKPIHKNDPTNTGDPRTLALGGASVKLFELANAYATMMTSEYRRPIIVSKVLDRYGKVIYDASVDEPSQQVISKRASFLMKKMLQAGLNGGTSSRLNGFVSGFKSTTSFGGKTGTTNSAADVLYAGVTPNLVGAAWVGGQFIGIRPGGQGAVGALPIWGKFISKVLNNPKYSRYKIKFPDTYPGINPACYGGPGVYEAQKVRRGFPRKDGDKTEYITLTDEQAAEMIRSGKLKPNQIKTVTASEMQKPEF